MASWLRHLLDCTVCIRVARREVSQPVYVASRSLFSSVGLMRVMHSLLASIDSALCLGSPSAGTSSVSRDVYYAIFVCLLVCIL